MILTKTKITLLLLFVFTLVFTTNVKAFSSLDIAQDRVLYVSQTVSLNERISNIENNLSPQSEGEPEDAKFTLRDRMEFYKTPGVSIAVVDKGKIDWARGYGVTDIDKNTAVDTQTLFQAASISKPLTAMAVLKLVQSGKLNLDDDVNQKLVSWKIPDNDFAEKTTLRNLLSHSAGVTVDGFDGYKSDEEVPTTIQILNGEKPANSDEIKVDGEPNKEFKYSGGGYVIVQQLLEDVTGKPFSAFMQQAVIDPLEMTNSTFKQPLPDSGIALAAVGHNDKGEVIEGGWHTYPELAAAGLWTTPSDLAQFIIEVQQSSDEKPGSFLNQDTVEEMLTPQIEGWGLGIELPEGESVRFVHGGANVGFQCLLVGYKNTGQGAIVMTNSDRGFSLAIEIINSIAREYGWRDRLPMPG